MRDPKSTPAPAAHPDRIVAPLLDGEPTIQDKSFERTQRERRRFYIDLHLKLFLVVGIALAWAGFSLWLSLPWIHALGCSITRPLAIALIWRPC